MRNGPFKTYIWFVGWYCSQLFLNQIPDFFPLYKTFRFYCNLGKFKPSCIQLQAIDHMHMTSQKGASCVGVKRNTATCVIAKHAARGANPASHTAGLAHPGPRTERLSANAHCQHNTCALRDTRLASLLWRCDPLWRQCIRSISTFY